VAVLIAQGCKLSAGGLQDRTVRSIQRQRLVLQARLTLLGVRVRKFLTRTDDTAVASTSAHASQETNSLRLRSWRRLIVAIRSFMSWVEYAHRSPRTLWISCNRLSRLREFGRGRHLQRRHRQGRVVVLAHGVAENPTREQILHRGQIQRPLVSVDLRHVPAPQHVRRHGGEVAAHRSGAAGRRPRPDQRPAPLERTAKPSSAIRAERC